MQTTGEQYSAALNSTPLLDDNMELVKRIAWQLRRRLPHSVQIEDLVQAGMIGLLEACDRYQSDEKASFSTFAGIRIRGAMLDEIRRGDWTPRSLHRAARAIKKARADIERRCGQPAPSADVAAELGMAVADYRRLHDDMALSHLSSLESVMAEQPGLETRTDEQDLPETAVEHRNLCDAVARVARRLPEREQRLLGLYYEDDCSMRQIGAHLGVSESRACQLHSRAIRRIRDMLDKAAGLGVPDDFNVQASVM